MKFSRLMNQNRNHNSISSCTSPDSYGFSLPVQQKQKLLIHGKKHESNGEDFPNKRDTLSSSHAMMQETET